MHWLHTFPFLACLSIFPVPEACNRSSGSTPGSWPVEKKHRGRPLRASELTKYEQRLKDLIVLQELYTYYTYYSTYIHLIIWSLPFFESCRIIDSSTSERCSEPLRSFLFFRNFMRPNLGSKKRIKTWYLTRILQNLFRKNPLGFSYANCFRPSVLPMISQFLSPISIYFLYISVEVTAWRCTRRVDMSPFSLMSKDSPRKRIPWSLVLVLLLNFSF